MDRKKVIVIIVTTVICLTPQQVNDKICDALCKKDFDGGYSKGNECFCYVNKGLIEDYSRGQMKVYRDFTKEAAPVVIFKDSY